MGNRWAEWREKQKIGLAEYNSPTYVTTWDQARERFRIFCEPTGKTLDVGCGITAFPMRYARGEQVELVGLDPLCPEPTYYSFVRGVAEHLPFRNDTFETCICASVLDHVIDPKDVLHEVRRTLRAHGRLCVWSGTYKTTNDDISAQLAILRQAIGGGRAGLFIDFARGILGSATRIVHALLGLSKDAGHFRHFSESSLIATLEGAGFMILRIGRLEGSVFVCACQYPDHSTETSRV